MNGGSNIDIALSQQEQERHVRFFQVLAATPRIFVMPALIAINVAVFALMVFRGVSFLEPSIDSLLRWGADYGPLTTQGEWWRVVTSMFLHIGVIHILMNMFVLLNIGAFTERLFGNVGFFVVYMLSGIGGSLVSLAWHPFTVSAGASGAIFGLYGALLGFLLLQRGMVPAQTLKSLLRAAFVFVGYNLLYGAAKSGIDMGAHLGGLATGALAGCALAIPSDSRMKKNVLVAIGGIGIAILCFFRIPVAEDVRPTLEHVGATETRLLELYNSSLNRWKSDQITGQQFAQSVQEKIIPSWTSEQQALAKLKHLSPPQQRLVANLLDYMAAQGEVWSLMAQGARTDDVNLVKKANEKQAQAEALATRIGNPTN